MSHVSLTRHLTEEERRGRVCAGLRLLIEQAGGAASDGRILDLVPHGLHQRVPVFPGSREEVAAATRYRLEYDARAPVAIRARA